MLCLPVNLKPSKSTAICLGKVFKVEIMCGNTKVSFLEYLPLLSPLLTCLQVSKRTKRDCNDHEFMSAKSETMHSVFR